MKYVVYLFGPLGCVLGMVVCMAMMARGNRRPKSNPSPAQSQELAALRAEIAELRGERSEADDG
jgi:hypothetical protein